MWLTGKAGALFSIRCDQMSAELKLLSLDRLVLMLYLVWNPKMKSSLKHNINSNNAGSFTVAV